MRVAGQSLRSHGGLGAPGENDTPAPRHRLQGQQGDVGFDCEQRVGLVESGYGCITWSDLDSGEPRGSMRDHQRDRVRPGASAPSTEQIVGPPSVDREQQVRRLRTQPGDGFGPAHVPRVSAVRRQHEVIVWVAIWVLIKLFPRHFFVAGPRRLPTSDPSGKRSQEELKMDGMDHAARVSDVRQVVGW